MTRVGHAVIGPPGHGVVQAALASACGLVARAPTPAALDPADLAGCDVVHVQVTDRLFGPDCAAAAVAFVELVRRLGRPVTVTLHDLPIPGDDPARYDRRAAACRAVVAAAAGVVVSSRHEARLLEATQPPPRPRAVIPLAIDRAPDPVPREPSADVGVLGWIYPGKGHAEVLAALPGELRLLALGDVSPGHDELRADLERAAAGRLTITGYVPEPELLSALRRVAVPVAAHREVSASASLGTWLAAGRRPLAADGPWVRELLDRCPGSLTTYRPPGLGRAIRAAVAEPDSTWLGEVQVGPGRAEVAARLEDFCRSCLR